MIKILIADSNINTINNFKSFIRKNFLDIKLEKSALNINDLKEGIERRKPDIIISDIRFFGSAAFQTIKDLNFRYPKMKFILYGGFNDTEYMKMCMTYGAVAYMYKPVKPSELERCIKEAIEAIEKSELEETKRNELMQQYQNQFMFFWTKFLSTLVHGHISSEEEAISGFEYFKLDIEPDYIAALVRVDHFKKIILTLTEEEKHLLIYEILNLINDKLKLINNGKAFINHFNEIVIILGKAGELEETVNLLNEIKELILSELNIRISIGVGKSYSSITDIKTSFNEANAALRYRCIVGYNSVIPIDHTEPFNRITYRYPIERENLLVYTAVIGEYEYCKRIVEEIFDSLENCGELPENLISQIIMDILISIYRNAVEQNLNIAGINKFFDTKEILKIHSIEEGKKYLINSLKDFCKYMIDIRKEKEDNLFKNAIDYVKNHYYENLTVQKIAHQFECSPEYFKKIFKDNSNKNFADYVTSIRIENAKKLILDTELDDETVAVNVGYNDVSAFRGIFKHNKGCSVSDYRFIKNRQLKKGLKNL